METEYYFAALRKYDQLPIGLEAYLTQALKTRQFKKKQKITQNTPTETFLSCITSGAARLYSTDRETHQEQSLDFFFKGDFIPLIYHTDLNQKKDLSIEFLEDTTALAITEKHYLFLPKIFPQILHLYHNIQQKHYLNQIERNILREILSAQTRYDQLQTLRPELFNRLSIIDMASFLGIHPNTLSALRGKK
ncbi:Crp/Fnr family transcriptional regulator [Pedobacter miscanthi]|nr:Crp/Fnr family transcriptional regulator [Pedobacter miscanthi]